MLWRASLAVALLCVGSICNCEQTALVSRVVLPREYRLKLCGREFIRSIIITCGGSQSRRSTQLDPFHWTSLRDTMTESSRHLGAELVPHSSSYSLLDLRALHRWQQALEVSQPSSETRGQQAAASGRRSRRNFSQGLADKCCFQGCNKNDIRHLC